MREHMKTGVGNQEKCIRKFRHYFPRGFTDQKYISWEREYKWNAHVNWEESLNKKAFSDLLKKGEFSSIAKKAASLESKTNLLFSFEKMALRDAIKPLHGARDFAEGLFNYVYGSGDLQKRFMNFADVLSGLPRKQTRVLTWPLMTVFGFVADPETHIFLKPKVTKTAALKYGFDFNYQSKPNWDTYQSLLDFAEKIRTDTKALKPKDYIDLQSFIWVMGSDEYPD